MFRSCSHPDSNSHSGARQAVGAPYFSSLLQRAVNQHQCVGGLPKEARLLSLCMAKNCTQTEVNCSRSGQTEIHCHPKTQSVLQTLGELHKLGRQIGQGLNHIHVMVLKYRSEKIIGCSISMKSSIMGAALRRL